MRNISGGWLPVRQSEALPRYPVMAIYGSNSLHCAFQLTYTPLCVAARTKAGYSISIANFALEIRKSLILCQDERSTVIILDDITLWCHSKPFIRD